MSTLHAPKSRLSRRSAPVDRGTGPVSAPHDGAGSVWRREGEGGRSGSDRRPAGKGIRAPRPWLLSAVEEQSLADRIKGGDKAAQHRLILANLPLVRAIVRDYKDCGIPLDDLIQEGNLGLIRASQDFDPMTYGNRFWNYASFWIRTSIHQALAANTSLVRCSEYVGLLRARYCRAVREFEERAEEPRGGADLEPAGLDEIAARMRVSLHTLKTARQARPACNPRFRTDLDGKPVALDELPAVSSPPESNLINQEDDDRVHGALSRLNPFEAWVIRERYGFREPRPGRGGRAASRQRVLIGPPAAVAGASASVVAAAPRPGQAYYPRTYAEISLDCGLSVHRVRLVEKTALDKLRKLLGLGASDEL